MDPKLEHNCLMELKQDLHNELEEFRPFTDDEFLMHFVRGKKYNRDKAAKAVRGYWNVRKHQYNFVFREINNLDKYASILKSGFIRVLKARDSKMRQILWCDFEHWSKGITSTDELTIIVILLVEELWNCVHVEREGIVIVVNLRGFGWEHIKTFTPLGVYRLTNIFWNNMPIRYQAIHLINAGSIFLSFLKGIKHFLPKTMRERLIIHENGASNLHADIPPKDWPMSLDGTLPDEDAYDDAVIHNILKKKNYYDNLVSVLTNNDNN